MERLKDQKADQKRLSPGTSFGDRSLQRFRLRRGGPQVYLGGEVHILNRCGHGTLRLTVALVIVSQTEARHCSMRTAFLLTAPAPAVARSSKSMKGNSGTITLSGALSRPERVQLPLCSSYRLVSRHRVLAILRTGNRGSAIVEAPKCLQNRARATLKHSKGEGLASCLAGLRRFGSDACCCAVSL